MPAERYIDTVFKSLDLAVEYDVISGWSVEDANIVIEHGSERTSVPSISAANYLIDLFQNWQSEAVSLSAS